MSDDGGCFFFLISLPSLNCQRFCDHLGCFLAGPVPRYWAVDILILCSKVRGNRRLWLSLPSGRSRTDRPLIFASEFRAFTSQLSHRAPSGFTSFTPNQGHVVIDHPPSRPKSHFSPCPRQKGSRLHQREARVGQPLCIGLGPAASFPL